MGRRVAGAIGGLMAVAGSVLVPATGAWAVTSPCTDGSAPAARSTVSCTSVGNFTLAVPAGTTSIDVDVVGAGGGAGYPARSHIGGHGAEVTGTATLPPGTTSIYVIVGTGGGGDNHGYGYGGTGSGVFALGAGQSLLAKLAVAGAGGGGSYNGDGGNAGAPGTSENPALAAPGAAGSGATGGAGGAGNYASGTAGGNDNPSSLTLAAGGNGGTYPNNSAGGTGGGGYAGGGGGATGNQGILNIYEAGGGGGSSYAHPTYLSAGVIGLKSGTGGVQLPGLVAGDGLNGYVTLTFNGPAVPSAPTQVTAAPGNTQATVSWTDPTTDGGSPITGFTVTSTPGSIVTNCPSSPCTVPGLANGTGYTFTVHAANANGDSPESDPSQSVTPALPPGVPTIGTATRGAGQASVTFTAPGSDGGSTITGYTVTSNPDGITNTCPSSPCTVSPLVNGTAYTFTVHATNAAGSSGESGASNSVTPADVPGAPTQVSAVPGDTQATVSFTAPAGNGGSAVTGYTITSSPGAIVKTCAASPCTVTGLANGTAYQFTVRATNAVGDSVASSASSAVTPASLPGTPTIGTATAGAGQAVVTFTAPGSDGGSTITGYTVTSNPGGITNTCPSSPCTVSPLANGTAYTFTVHATNAIGSSGESGASNATTPADVPAAPTVTATALDGGVRVQFAAPSNEGSPITRYEISTDGGGTWATLPTTPTGATLSGTVTGLTNGTQYGVRVRAVNAKGDGHPSTNQSITPAAVPGAPTAVSATRGNGSAAVTFTAPGSTGGAAITSYTVTATPGGLTASCPSSPCTISGLTNGTAYTFTVHATNGTGDSAESTASSAVTPATVPAAPATLTFTPAATSAVVSFADPANGGSPITGYEVSTDGGQTWNPLDADRTIPGLTPETSYQVQVRAINAAGTGPASTSAALSTVPVAPAAPTATAGTASVVVTWTQASSSTVTGYTVYAHPGPATCTTNARTATSCVIGAVSGTSYTYTVVAHAPSGDSADSLASTPVTAANPEVPPAAPTAAPTTLTTTEGTLSKVSPSQQITIVGTGFAPYSTATVVLYSSPVVLGTATTDANGSFTKQVTIPASIPAGSHNLVASGVDSNGNTHQLRMPVTTAAASTPSSGSGGLPVTGASVTVLAIWAGLVTAAGVGLVAFGARRPRTR
ncbi:beta strand repeat-containing protein [Dactylosporangium sp. CS-047395]|uniref:beta strand repeat-containing protein n=1 Tax=Dactylosporangium sp. CS-047395 TaxID=3239936 RepID=UPI003D8F31B4